MLYLGTFLYSPLVGHPGKYFYTFPGWSLVHCSLLREIGQILREIGQVLREIDQFLCQ